MYFFGHTIRSKLNVIAYLNVLSAHGTQSELFFHCGIVLGKVMKHNFDNIQMAESTLRYECVSPVDGWLKFDRNVVVLNSYCWITAATGARPESSEQTGSATMRGERS